MFGEYLCTGGVFKAYNNNYQRFPGNPAAERSSQLKGFPHH